MSQFKSLPEFDKELEKLSKKYPSLKQDIKNLEGVLEVSPIGFGKNFVTINHSSNVRVVKTRLACRSLRDRSMRVIYAYHDNIVTFVYIEIYFKGDKENEDHERLDEYIKNIK